MARLRLLVVVMIQFTIMILALHGIVARAKILEDISGILNGGRVGVSISPSTRVQYTREAEVNEKCPSLTLRDEDASLQSMKRWALMNRFSFYFGDWEQADLGPGADPLMPYIPSNPDPSLLPATAQLVTLRVLDVRTSSGRSRLVSGVMELRITDAQGHNANVRFGKDPRFDQKPGISLLSVQVEGIHQEAENEDVLCLLGCTYLPSNNRSEKDCNIMIQLHYPLTFNLTSRVIRGTIQSLVAQGESSDFSLVSLSSQLKNDNRYNTRYEATAESLVTSACWNIAEEQVAVDPYNASIVEFCQVAENYLNPWNPLKILPNWNCSSSPEFCEKIGPFSHFSAHSAFQMDYNTSSAQIIVQNFGGCIAESGATEIPVSFVLRLVPDDENLEFARGRSALDGQTLVAEGMWKNGSDTLCMVACKLDDASGQPDACHVRICFQLPTSLSIMRRNVFEGRISSLLPEDHPDSFFPLDFFGDLPYIGGFPPLYLSALHYNYTVLDYAGALLERHEVGSHNSPKVPWSKFPSLAGGEDSHYKALADDLALQTSLRPAKELKYTDVNFKIISIDGFLTGLSGYEMSAVPLNDGSFLERANDTIVTETDPKTTHRHSESRPLNCSGTLELSRYDVNVSNRLIILLEGFYKPGSGKLYMVGCRNVKAPWVNISEYSLDLTRGMDCQIEVILTYPTTVAAWLLNPGMKLNVHSNRPVDDLFHFDDVDAETTAIYYREQRESIVSAKTVEAALSIVTLSLMVACILGQLLYIGRHEESAPYVSLLMVGVLAMGYALPLITSAESLLLRKFDYRKVYFYVEPGATQLIAYADKVFTLIALVLLLRLFEKVWRERVLLDAQQPASRAPRERNVAVICFIIHAVGFASVMALHSRGGKISGRDDLTIVSTRSVGWVPNANISAAGDSKGRFEWNRVLKEYSGLVDDLFLLPQAIAFAMWDVQGKPLRITFFVGLTLLQIVPHIYDHLRGSRFNDYSLYANPDFDFYTNVGNILIPILALLLAILVYCQQRWNGLLRFPTKFLYHRVGGKYNETELMTTNGRRHLPPIPEDE